MRYVIFCFFYIVLVLSINIFYFFTYIEFPSLFYPYILFYDVFVLMILIPPLVVLPLVELPLVVLTVEVVLDREVVFVVAFVVVLLKFIVFVDITVVLISVKFCSGPSRGTTSIDGTSSLYGPNG